MARNDGIDRTSVRNANLTRTQIGNAQRHNEREKDSYTNPDIVPERAGLNIHFKKPTGNYAEMFATLDKGKHDKQQKNGLSTLPKTPPGCKKGGVFA
jgi:hypothetical protein